MVFGNAQPTKPLVMYGRELQFVNELKYLGVTVVSGKLFSISVSPMLRKFRSAANTILNAHRRSSDPVLMKLVYAVAVPLLTYACETLPITAKQLNEMTVALNDVIRRIFSFHRWESVSYLRQTCGYLSITEIVHHQTETFLKHFPRTDNLTLNRLKAIVIA